MLSQQAEPCQSLLSASSANSQCVPVGNCTGLRCEQRNNVLNGSSAWFTVQKCEDPVIVDVTIQSGTQNTPVLQQSFTQNETVFLGGSNSLSVAMQRNASYLQFQVIKNNIIIVYFCIIITRAYKPLIIIYAIPLEAYYSIHPIVTKNLIYSM